MQEVSSAVQTQAWKGVVLRQTATQAAIQIEVVIQIQAMDHIMLFLPTVNNKEIKYSLLGPNRETKTNNDSNSNLKNRPYNAPLPNNNEIEYFLAGPN